MRSTGLRSRVEAATPRVPMGGTVAGLRRVSATLGGRRVLHAVDLAVAAGDLVAVVGPNGAGKSTVVGVLGGDIGPEHGSVTLDGRPLADWSPGERARRRAVLPQQTIVTFPFTVAAIVAMGRAPWSGAPEQTDDADAVAGALRDADVGHLADRPVPMLSGGERARVALARLLAQRTQLMLLDEPTAALDVRHQELVLECVRRRTKHGDAAVVVLHDLALAAAHADRVVVVADGRVVADGPPGSVLTGELLSRVYRHPVEVIAHPNTGEPLVLPVRGGIR